jgi:hypothetical protein
MPKQLLYYEHAVPVSSELHRDWSLEPRSSYDFAARSNSVPLVTGEFNSAQAEYAIVFLETGDVIQPTVLLGLKPDENLFVDANGKWDARYIPAFVRRYPFVFSKHQDGDRLTLCLDEEHAGWNQDGRGQRLFDTEGERTEYLEKVLGFVQDYQRQFELTQAFGQRLKELGLLQPMAARFKLPSGEKAALSGFMAVDRDKLKALPGDTLEDLVKTEALDLIYAHLASLKNVGAMLKRIGVEAASTDTTDDPPGDIPGLRSDDPLA